jgi:hypothetical protein
LGFFFFQIHNYEKDLKKNLLEMYFLHSEKKIVADNFLN